MIEGNIPLKNSGISDSDKKASRFQISRVLDHEV